MSSEQRWVEQETAVASISTLPLHPWRPSSFLLCSLHRLGGTNWPAGLGLYCVCLLTRGSQGASFLHRCWGIQAQLLVLAWQALSRLNHILSLPELLIFSSVLHLAS